MAFMAGSKGFLLLTFNEPLSPLYGSEGDKEGPFGKTAGSFASGDLNLYFFQIFFKKKKNSKRHPQSL